MWYAILILSICYRTVVNTGQVMKTFSGVYTDNGFDQTVAYQVQDDLEKKEIEFQILDILGLPERPQQNWTETSLTESAPHFLLKMYEKLNDGGDNNKIGQRAKRHMLDYGHKLVTPLDEKELSESDNIMTFMSSESTFSNEPIFKTEMENMLWFNITNMPKNLNLITAQIKLYKHRSKISHKRFEVAVYSIEIRNTNEIGLELISTIETRSKYQGWIELNVTAVLRKWIFDPINNKGLYISASMFGNFTRKDVALRNMGLNSISSKSEFKPFIVGYFNGPDKISLPQNLRSKRKVTNPLTKPDDLKTPRSCQKLNFSVDFKKLNWQNWIIAPDVFESYFCSGDCSFPLNAEMNTTNHAIMQTLVRLNNPDIPKPCCVPVALSSISVLYHFSEKIYNIKIYNNMVVKNCGCL